MRKNKLKLTHRVFITSKAHKALREQKVEQGKSMAKIVCDLIINSFKK